MGPKDVFLKSMSRLILVIKNFNYFNFYSIDIGAPAESERQRGGDGDTRAVDGTHDRWRESIIRNSE